MKVIERGATIDRRPHASAYRVSLPIENAHLIADEPAVVIFDRLQ
jgi:hypothetical protein